MRSQNHKPNCGNLTPHEYQMSPAKHFICILILCISLRKMVLLSPSTDYDGSQISNSWPSPLTMGPSLKNVVVLCSTVACRWFKLSFKMFLIFNLLFCLGPWLFFMLNASHITCQGASYVRTNFLVNNPHHMYETWWPLLVKLWITFPNSTACKQQSI